MEEKATCNTQGQSGRVVNPRPYDSLPHPCLAAQGWGARGWAVRDALGSLLFAAADCFY